MTLHLNIEKIISLYKSGENFASIAKTMNTTSKTIIQYLDKAGVDRKIFKTPIPRPDISNEYIIELLKNGKSTEEISKLLNFAPQLIRARMRSINFSIKSCRDTVNHMYFNLYNNKSCYWAGFISADGWVGTEKKQNMLGIEIKDELHLNNLYKELGARGKIYSRQRKKTQSITYSFSLTSKKIIENLNNNFNIIPRKSLILRPPNNVPEEYVSDFIRGYIDGDGCFVKNSYNINILGTKEMLEWIKMSFNKFCNLSITSKITKKPKSKVYFITIGGRIQCCKIIEWLYKDSTENTRLDRKYEIIQSYLKSSKEAVKKEIERENKILFLSKNNNITRKEMIKEVKCSIVFLNQIFKKHNLKLISRGSL